VTLNSLQLINLWPSDSRSNWNLEMLVFDEGGKIGGPREKTFGARTRTNNKLNPHMKPGSGNEPGHIGGRRVPSSQHHPRSPTHIKTWFKIRCNQDSDCKINFFLARVSKSFLKFFRTFEAFFAFWALAQTFKDQKAKNGLRTYTCFFSFRITVLYGYLRRSMSPPRSDMHE